jgi:hypothetical protein
VSLDRNQVESVHSWRRIAWIGRGRFVVNERDNPGTPAGILSDVTPLIQVELVHSKAELAAVLGPSGSEARNILAKRSMLPGFDFASVWMLFLFVLYQLKSLLKVEARVWTRATFIMIIATLLLERKVIDATVAVANAAPFTNELFDTFQSSAEFKWDRLFTTTVFCAALFWRTLRFGGELMGLAAAIACCSSSNTRLLAPLILVMFAALCGLSTLLVSPGLLSDPLERI